MVSFLFHSVANAAIKKQLINLSVQLWSAIFYDSSMLV